MQDEAAGCRGPAALLEESIDRRLTCYCPPVLLAASALPKSRPKAKRAPPRQGRTLVATVVAASDSGGRPIAISSVGGSAEQAARTEREEDEGFGKLCSYCLIVLRWLHMNLDSRMMNARKRPE